MIEIPVYNKVNRSYGNRGIPEIFREQVASLQKYGFEAYDLGDYSGVVSFGWNSVGLVFKDAKKKGLEEGFASIGDIDLAWLYIMGKSSYCLDRFDDAVGFLKIVASQHGFRERMLPEFRDYPAKALSILKGLGETKGEDYINEYNVEKFVESAKTGGRCFIATAAYGAYRH